MSSGKNYKKFLEFSSDVFPKEKLLLDPFLSRYYRPFSLRLSWLLYKTKITPNFVTFLQIIIGLSACLVIALFPKQEVFILGIIFLHLAYLLDCSDGEIARAKKMSSLEGLFLDKFAHAITMPSIFMAVSMYYSQYFIGYQFFILLISFIASLCTFNPVNRLLTSIVQQLITKKEYSQYDLSKYSKNSKLKDENDDLQILEDEYLVTPKEISLKKRIKRKMLRFGKQFFRHVSYLFFVTILLILELLGVPILVIFIFWFFLLLSVIAKEIYGFQLVVFKNLILKRYSRVEEKIKQNF
tara:strand:- start:1529 stop:2419 length:891 start_codon:yes stop_codon:yes gene_type:complete